MITIKATSMYNVAKEAQEDNRAKFDVYLVNTIRDCASAGRMSVSFDENDEMWEVLTEQQQADVVKELKNAGFFVGTRRFGDPLYVYWKGEQQR